MKRIENQKKARLSWLYTKEGKYTIIHMKDSQKAEKCIQMFEYKRRRNSGADYIQWQISVDTLTVVGTWSRGLPVKPA
jgi:hypothetical protein